MPNYSTSTASLAQKNIDAWDLLYQRDEFRYGSEPSKASRMALPLLEQAETLLELGAGYGRDALWLAKQLPSLKITALDSSPTAIRMLSERTVSNVVPVRGDAFNCLSKGMFAVLFSNFFYHLFQSTERQHLFRLANSMLRASGLFVNSFASVGDEKCGLGKEVEPGTYACYADRPWHVIHFYSSEELVEEHAKSGFEIDHIEESTETEHICGLIEYTRFWFVVARKGAE